MKNTPTLVLAGCLTLASLCHAGPKPKAQPPAQPSPLAAGETLCEALGTFTRNRALDRNRGFSLFESLRASRAWDATHGADAELQRVHDFLIRKVYKNLQHAPAALQQHTEVECLEEVFKVYQAGQQPATPAKDRY